jgi:hypothetical protein
MCGSTVSAGTERLVTIRLLQSTEERIPCKAGGDACALDDLDS